MATTRTIRPDGGSHSGMVVDFGVASDLSDDTDSTQVQGSLGDANATISFGTYALASDERCKEARFRWRGWSRVGAVRTRLLLSGNNGPYTSHANSETTGNRNGSYLADPPGSPTEWTQTEIDAIQAYVDWVSNYNGVNNPNLSMYEGYIDLTIIKEATASISGPSAGSTVASLTPTVSWTYVGNGESQKRYRVKVFTEATVIGGGFDPDTSSAEYDSGWVVSSATSKQVTTPLSYGTDYRVYVQVSKDFNGADWDGPWSTGSTFSVMSQPTATVTDPSGTVTLTNKPTIEWTYADDDESPQTAFQARVFDEPGSGWGGFDPDAATPVWDSGVVVSSEGQVTVTTGLANLTNFRSYVKVRKSTPGEVWGPWDFEDFDTDFVAPLAPTISTTSHDDRIDIEIDPQTNGVDPDPDWINVFRSLDEGATWDTFRYGTLEISEELDPGDFSPFVITDYEVPLGKEVSYKAVAVSTSTGQEVASVDSSVETGEATGVVVWIKDPSDSSLGRHFMVADKWLPVTVYRRRLIEQPMGRSLPVVIRSDGRGDRFTLNLLVLSEEEHDDLMTLLLGDRTLFIQTTKGNWYAEIAQDFVDRMHLWDALAGEEDAHQIQVPFVEVDF